MYFAILMGTRWALYVGGWSSKSNEAQHLHFYMESLHFGKRGFHAGASAVEVGAFLRGIRMLAQPLARWLAAWAGLIGWLAGLAGLVG